MPTVGRPSLHAALAPLLGRVKVTVVDDRPSGADLDLPDGVRVLRSCGGGPAAARNTGWRATDAAWVAFLDDDVVPPADWVALLERDLAACDADVGASQGRIRVPLPADRRPTDWERSTAGLETAVWATADMAYRRTALEDVGGFDERFPRAYREDADLGLRVTQAGWRIERGARTVDHPVRPSSWRQSARAPPLDGSPTVLAFRAVSRPPRTAVQRRRDCCSRLPTRPSTRPSRPAAWARWRQPTRTATPPSLADACLGPRRRPPRSIRLSA